MHFKNLSPRLPLALPLLSSPPPSSMTRQGHGETVCSHSNQHTSLATSGQPEPPDSHMTNNLRQKGIKPSNIRNLRLHLIKNIPKLELLK